MENKENDLTGKKREIVYLCNGEVPYCEKTICYKTKPSNFGVCKHTADVRYALNFRKDAGALFYYEKEDQKKTEGYRFEVPRTIGIDGVEIPTYQALWEKDRKTNLRIDRCTKTLIVITLAEVALALTLLFK